MRTSKIHATLALAILLGIGVQTSFAQCNAALFAGGAGTEANPYQISTAQQLQNLNQCLGDTYYNNYYVLNNDIDLTAYLASGGAGYNNGEGWQSIGPGSFPGYFEGKLNGNGHKVSGLWVNRPAENYAGLFEYIIYGEIKNIGVEIDDSKGGVRGGNYVGGLVGRNEGTISNSYVKGNVSGNNYVGGLAGYNRINISIIINSYATGSVIGNNYVGGLVGYNGYNNNSCRSIISNSYAAGSVTGSSNVGGLAWYNSSSSIIGNSFYDKETSNIDDTDKEIGKSTSEMKTQGTYDGWDFEGIWEINPAKNNGYPTLTWQNPEHLGSAVVSIIPSQTWTGNSITPKPSVIFGSVLLSEETDFTYSYSNNIQIGTATVRIVGKGIYLGQAKVVEFNIVRASCGTGFADGAGTQANPYKITEAKNLGAIGNCLSDPGNTSYSNKYYELQNDIDLGDYLANSSVGWLSFGNNFFSGKLNGNGYKVSGLWINRPAENGVGLFGVARGGEIRNIGVEIDDSKGGIRGNNYVGGLIGNNESGTISNSYVKGSVTGSDWVGGLVGSHYYSTISNNFAAGNVSGNNYVGGLVGENQDTISNSYATGSVMGNQYVGGLVGRGGGTISNSYVKGSVTGSDWVGGLVGQNYYSNSIISNSYYDKETSCMKDTGKGTGKSTDEMKTQSTYEGWDFEGTWEISSAKNNGYPTLFWQNPEHLANAIVAAIPNQTWTGSPITTPKPSVSFKGNVLNEWTDFVYSYDNNIQTGTATVRIVGRGTYMGQAKAVEFNIVRASCGTGFAGGTGTQTNPYKIAEAKNLDAIGNCLGSSYSDKYYELQNDIDLGSYIASTSAGWQSIGGNNDSYYGELNVYGELNGNGHKVSGLWINRPAESGMGLFGSISGEIRNVGVEIDDAKGGVRGGNYVGGLVGSGGTISNSYVKGNVSGYNYVGGLVGSGGTISNSYATGSVAGNNYVGGLVGSGGGTNSYATGNVTGSDYVGGLVGSGGGTNSYATGSVTGSNYVGGLSGRAGVISNSYATGSVTGSSYVGGLVGYNYNNGDGSSKINNSYATGNVTGTGNYVGGLVGQNYGNSTFSISTISNSYATGNVSGSGNYVGGLVGSNGSGIISNSYYDKETSCMKDTGKGTGKSTAEMKTQSTYVGWNFENTWVILNTNYINSNGYPILQWQLQDIISKYPIVSYIPPQQYTGSAIEPAFTVTFNKAALTKGSDYTVSYSNNIKAGTAKIAITGIGSYSHLEPIEAYFAITAKPVTISVTVTDKEYDGTTTAIVGTATVSGKVSSDNVTIIQGTASYADKNAGTNKTVTFSGFSLDGTDAINYTLTAQPASVTANITAKPITITGVTATNRDYNGTTTVELTGGTLLGVLSSDAVGFVLGIGTVATPDAGNGKAVATNITLTGADASNYTLTQPTDITATIPAPTPILTNRENPYIGSISIQTTTNSILLSNLPQGAKVDVYSLQGKRIYSAYPENPKILEIGVQTKGMYIIKAGNQSARVVVR